jgi:hypothetical protein
MFRNKTAALALAVGSFVSMAAPSAALAHDRDDGRWRNNSRQERRLSARELRAAEQRRIAQERYLRQQQMQQRQRYSSPYGYSAPSGYYDRYGQWHNYR